MKIIREAVENDIVQIIPILYQVSELHYNARPDVFKKKTEEDMKEYAIEALKDEEMKMIVATDETSKIYGILIYKVKEIKNHINLEASKSIWIDELCVDEKFRKMGIGKMLMQEVEDIAKKLGCKKIELNCWEFNENAIKFYEEIRMTTQKRVMEMKIGDD